MVSMALSHVHVMAMMKSFNALYDSDSMVALK